MSTKHVLFLLLIFFFLLFPSSHYFILDVYSPGNFIIKFDIFDRIHVDGMEYEDATRRGMAQQYNGQLIDHNVKRSRKQHWR